MCVSGKDDWTKNSGSWRGKKWAWKIIIAKKYLFLIIFLTFLISETNSRMRTKNLAFLLLSPLTSALRTSNFGQNSVFDIFVETNSIENTTVSETSKAGAIGITPPPHDQHAK